MGVTFSFKDAADEPEDPEERERRKRERDEAARQLGEKLQKTGGLAAAIEKANGLGAALEGITKVSRLAEQLGGGAFEHITKVSRLAEELSGGASVRAAAGIVRDQLDMARVHEMAIGGAIASRFVADQTAIGSVVGKLAQDAAAFAGIDAASVVGVSGRLEELAKAGGFGDTFVAPTIDEETARMIRRVEEMREEELRRPPIRAYEVVREPSVRQVVREELQAYHADQEGRRAAALEERARADRELDPFDGDPRYLSRYL